MSLKLTGPLVLAGAGKMGGALLRGLLARGLDPKSIVIQDPKPGSDVVALAKEHGLRLEAELGRLDTAPAVIMAAVKPQIMEDVFPALAKRAGSGTLTLSIAAGRPMASFEKHLAPGSAVVRAMPNTPAAIGRGMTVCAANRHVSESQKRLAHDLMTAVGDVGWIDDEALMDAVTAVSGSGPAYVFLLAECLAEAGRRAGLDAALAGQLARATISGSGELLRLSELSAASLRENVTSPGGTTAAALGVLMGPGGFQELLARAVEAAVQRGRELSK